MAIAFGFSVVVSLLLLIFANIAARRWRHPAGGVGVWSLAAAILPMCLSIVSSVVIMQGILMTAGALFVSRERPRRFLPISIGATLCAYAIAAGLSYRQMSELRQQFPMESMEARLPVPRDSKAIPLDAESKSDLAVAEGHIRPNGWRSRLLQDLHNNSVELFLSQPGFGISRMNMGLDRAFTPPADREPVTPSDSLELLSAGVKAGPMTEIRGMDEKLRSLHGKWLPEFFESGYLFGYFRDRKHVAGFRPHEFASRPWIDERTEVWPRVERVELVGLVVHAEPVAYRTNGLPTMSTLSKIPIRPLDAFETKGLDALESGEPLFVRQTTTGLRMLGPIRAGNACLECHGCERGTLLGAFSYRLESAAESKASGK